MPSKLQPITQLDFSGGENTVSSPYDVKQNQLIQAVNLILDEHGSLRVRDGTLIQGAQSPLPTRPIVKLYDLALVDNTVVPLAIIYGTSLNTLYDRSASPWTLLGTFDTRYQIPDIQTFTNLAIFAPGNTEVMKYYDGTTFGALTGAPNAAHCAIHFGYLWAWNTNNSTTATAGPSSLQASDVNNPNSWTPTSQVFVSKDDGQQGHGLGLFTIAETGISPTATLIAFKDFSAYEVSGVFGGTLSIQKIKSDMGCVAPRSVQFISGFGIIRLSHRGFALYDGVNDTLISEEERPRIFGRDSYTGIDWSNVSLSYATQVANPPLYICACPTTGSNGSLTRVFVYDLVRKSWTILAYANGISTFQLILNPEGTTPEGQSTSSLPYVLGGDFNTGYVRQYFNGASTDDNVPIAWMFQTRPATGVSPMDRMYVLRMLLQVYGFATGTNITSTFYYGPNSQSVTQQVKALSATVSLAGYGSGGWGTGPWGDPSMSSPTTGYGQGGWGQSPWGDPTNILFEETLQYYILGGAITNAIYANVSGSGPGKIRGLEWHIRGKALTRSVTSVTQ